MGPPKIKCQVATVKMDSILGRLDGDAFAMGRLEVNNSKTHCFLPRAATGGHKYWDAISMSFPWANRALMEFIKKIKNILILIAEN